MFWRSDSDSGLSHPLSGGSKPDWPRNGAVLTGFVHGDNPQTAWLEVISFQQAGSADSVATPGCWMQFDQGGLLLHKL